jgi:outer membrane lipoprotein SlyB
MLRWLMPAAVAAVLLGGCALPGQDRYHYSEVGRSFALAFGTVVAVRDIEIIGHNTGVGGLIGAAAGAGAGTAIGSGRGTGWAVLGGLVIGAIAGALIEQATADRAGLEYTVRLETGVILTVAQEKGDQPLQPGERVVVRNSGGYQRVLPAAHISGAGTSALKSRE